VGTPVSATSPNCSLPMRVRQRSSACRDLWRRTFGSSGRTGVWLAPATAPDTVHLWSRVGARCRSPGQSSRYRMAPRQLIPQVRHPRTRRPRRGSQHARAATMIVASSISPARRSSLPSRTTSCPGRSAVRRADRRQAVSRGFARREARRARTRAGAHRQPLLNRPTRSGERGVPAERGFRAAAAPTEVVRESRHSSAEQRAQGPQGAVIFMRPGARPVHFRPPL
jgi:hypothetical protein